MLVYPPAPRDPTAEQRQRVEELNDLTRRLAIAMARVDIAREALAEIEPWPLRGPGEPAQVAAEALAKIRETADA